MRRANIGPGNASLATLRRRVKYGGRKGRSAWLRFRARKNVPLPQTLGEFLEMLLSTDGDLVAKAVADAVKYANRRRQA